MTVFLSLTFVPAQLKAGTDPIPTSMSVVKIIKSAKANALLIRLDGINAMDKSTMTSSEKKQLRKEVRSIKNQLGEIGGGVYISVGALIIIILLLIILL